MVVNMFMTPDPSSIRSEARKSASLSMPTSFLLASITGRLLMPCCAMISAAISSEVPSCTVITSRVMISPTFTAWDCRILGCVLMSLPTKFICEGSIGTIGR